MLDSKKAFSYFTDKHNIKESTNDWYTFDCPFCGKEDKHAVSFEHNSCKCWVCGYKDSIQSFIMDCEGLEYGQVKKLVNSYDPSPFFKFDFTHVANTTSASIQLPFGYKPITYGTSILADRARAYLIGRGYSIDYMDKLGIGYVDQSTDHYFTDYFGYIIIPFKKKGRLYYFNARNFMEGNPRYKNPSSELYGIGKAELVWNDDALLYKNRIFVMEGVFSALTVGDEGIALMGKAISKKQIDKLIASPCTEVVVCLDQGCHKESFEVIYPLLTHKSSVKYLKLTDGDPNDLGRDKIMELYRMAKPLNYATVFDILDV